MEEHKKEHHHSKKHIEHKGKFKIKKSDFWKYTAIVAVLLLIISIAKPTSDVEGELSAQDAAKKAVTYINDNLLQSGTSAELSSVTESGGVYVVNISIGKKDFISYVTKDGIMLFTGGIKMDKVKKQESPRQEPSSTTPKSDKPEVELFIMSHCPYGTQAEKGILSAVKTLGDEIDFKIRFVYYAMHGEKEVKEQLNQYCIQKEQNNKFITYLECFLGEGDGATCLAETGIDQEKLDACVESADKEFDITTNLEDKSKWLSGRYPKFNTDAELNTKYSVGGSPTLIINGAKSSSGRDSASFLSSICAAFNDAPGECDEELSSAQPSPGFGFNQASAGPATSAQCG